MNNYVKKTLEDLKQYCTDYINTTYGTNNNYIRRIKITKNGLFIYGHKVYAPILSDYYTIYTFISWYDANDYEHIRLTLEHFVLDCQRLIEAK